MHPTVNSARRRTRVTEPYWTLRRALAPTLRTQRAIALVGAFLIALVVGGAGYLDSSQLVGFGLLALILISLGYVDPRQRMRRQARAILDQARYDPATLRLIAELAQLGAATPWRSFDAAILQAVRAQQERQAVEP